MLIVFLSLFIYEIDLVVSNKIDVCASLQCDNDSEKVCAIRTEGKGFRLKLFQSECDLLKHQCEVQNDLGYDIIDINYCLQAFKTEPNSQTSKLTSTKSSCIEQDCRTDTKKVCGIKNDGEGFRVRLFGNKCKLWKYNCENQNNFTITDLQICNGMQLPENKTIAEDTMSTSDDTVDSLIVFDNITENNHNSTDQNPDKLNAEDHTNSNQLYSINKENDLIENDVEDKKPDKVKNLIVVRSSMFDFNRINESIEHFFAATHVFDLPVKEMDNNLLNETTRRRLVKVAGPIKVFVPWVTIPKNISDDFEHRPTLSTCYHKCPRKCPSTYAPVCGVPGIVAREPSLMFQNHCFMDVAQCKMFWENKSPTALSSSYVESSFLFCLGDEMNGMYRFLPLIRTLQHMGRLRKKGHFHYRFKNMKFFNNLLARQPKFMG